jgi:hypothetical protein
MLTRWNLAPGLTATVLFDIVLGVFTQWQTVCGKIVGMFDRSLFCDCFDSGGLCRRSQFWMRHTNISSTAIQPVSPSLSAMSFGSNGI